MSVLLSCEHAGAEVPAELATLFESPVAQAALASHEGSDLGAGELARALAARLDAPLHPHLVSRLVVDANRSERNPAVFSRFTRGLARPERELLLARHHRPHRARVADALERTRAEGGSVVHLAVHSFTPVFRGTPRGVDVGLLYDPSREGERALCVCLQDLLRARTGWRVYRNAPYRGASDGLPTALRRRWPTGYVGIELEVSQRWLSGPDAETTADALAECLLRALSVHLDRS